MSWGWVNILPHFLIKNDYNVAILVILVILTLRVNYMIYFSRKLRSGLSG